VELVDGHSLHKGIEKEKNTEKKQKKLIFLWNNKVDRTNTMDDVPET